MATRSQAQPATNIKAPAQPLANYNRRSRSVWFVLAVSSILFFVVCSASGVGMYNYVSSVTRAQHAQLQRVRGSQLTLLRHQRVDPEAVQNSTALNEGDEVRTGPETEASVSMFDESNIYVYFSSRIGFPTLHSSRFIGNRGDVSLNIISGTMVLSTIATGATSDYSNVRYTITTPQSEIEVDPGSTVRVQIDDQSPTQSTLVAVTFGSAAVMSAGKRVELQPGNMTVVNPDSAPTEPRAAERELIRNGNFDEPPTSGAEVAGGENGGLGTAAWLPIHEQSGEPVTDPVSVTVKAENLPGRNIMAGVITRSAGPTSRYIRGGMRQEINAPAAFYNTIVLEATIKVVQQTEPVGGPQGDVFPLTIRVEYLDSKGNKQTWRRSFYWSKTDLKFTNAYPVSLGSWQALTEIDNQVTSQQGKSDAQAFVLKGMVNGPDGSVTAVGQDISVLNAIEIYGIGSDFQSWVTGVSLLAR